LTCATFSAILTIPSKYLPFMCFSLPHAFFIKTCWSQKGRIYRLCRSVPILHNFLFWK
jgi:hypothetical protein